MLALRYHVLFHAASNIAPGAEIHKEGKPVCCNYLMEVILSTLL